MLRNYTPRSDLKLNPGDADWSVSDVLIACAAAPTFFRPLYKDGRMYVDGAVTTLNNPAQLALLEAKADINIESDEARTRAHQGNNRKC